MEAFEWRYWEFGVEEYPAVAEVGNSTFSPIERTDFGAYDGGADAFEIVASVGSLAEHYGLFVKLGSTNDTLIEPGEPVGALNLADWDLWAETQFTWYGHPDGVYMVCGLIGSILTLDAFSPPVGGLIAQVEEMGLPEGTSSSLITSLEGAAVKIEEGNTQAAIGKLEAFINKVEAQRGKKIPEAETDALIAQAQALIDSLTD